MRRPAACTCATCAAAPASAASRTATAPTPTTSPPRSRSTTPTAWARSCWPARRSNDEGTPASSLERLGLPDDRKRPDFVLDGQRVRRDRTPHHEPAQPHGGTDRGDPQHPVQGDVPVHGGNEDIRAGGEPTRRLVQP